MTFNSLAYAIFLPSVFLLYWFVFNKNLKHQNLFIVAASCLFYGWWDWRFLGLLVFTAICSWGSGILIDRYRGRGKAPGRICLLNVLLNLSILAVFKYFGFFVRSFCSLFPEIGSDGPVLRIILPVGISFYTFQAIGYTVDVYKGRIAPTKDLAAFLAFICFFPQLVAGPIERSTSLLPQFQHKRDFDGSAAADGLRLILWGLFKKVVVADTCARYVDSVFNAAQPQPGSALLMAILLFSFQIYGDFSGYSDIAIGSARLFGIQLIRNFNLPFFSQSIPEFWRRWHISLTTWLRDYVYLPLGGSHGSRLRTIRNTFIVFLASGLWHGADYTFIVWGAFHAVLFIPAILSGKRRLPAGIPAAGRFLPGFPDLARMCLTFLLVSLGWIFFRSESLAQSWAVFCRLPAQETLTAAYKLFLLPETRMCSLWAACMLLLEWTGRDRECPLRFDRIRTPLLRYVIYTAIVLLIIYTGEPDGTPFIYFQF